MKAKMPTHKTPVADLVLCNGKIFTAERQNEFVQSIAITNGVISRLGSNEEVHGDIQADTQVIDLAGKLVMPGMIDGHLHLLHASVGMLSASLYGDQHVDIARLENNMKKWCTEKDKYRGNILYVVEVDASYWTEVSTLNRIFNQGQWADIPIFLYGSDQHSGWTNRKGLEEIGITSTVYASLHREKQQHFGLTETGELDGTAIDSGLDILLNVIPGPTTSDLIIAAQKGIDYLHSLGITAWMDAAANVLPGKSVYDIEPSEQAVGTLPIYQTLQQRGTLNTHVATLLVVNADTDPQKIRHYVNVREKYHDADGVSVVGIKIFQDGIPMFPAQTAAMIDPYKNSGKFGDRFHTPTGFADLVTEADKNNFIVHVHTVGDQAVRDALDAIQVARKCNGNADIAHSLTHLQFISPVDIPRFKALNIIASIPFAWIGKNPRNENLVKPFVTAEAYQDMFATRALQEAGTMLSTGSDWPIDTPSPWIAMYKGVTRCGELGVLNAQQSISLKEIAYAYTANAAKELGMQDHIGSLCVGKVADFIILDRDIFEVDIDSVKNTQVLSTYFKGREIYTQGTSRCK